MMKGFNIDYIDGFTIHQLQDKETKQIFYKFGDNWLFREDDTTYGVLTNFKMIEKLDDVFQEWLNTTLGGDDGRYY